MQSFKRPRNKVFPWIHLHRPTTQARRYNPNAQCDYHQGAGHTTDQCIVLRHRIQDLIENGSIIAPGTKPNVTTNHVHRLDLGLRVSDPTKLISPSPLDLNDLVIELGTSLGLGIGFLLRSLLLHSFPRIRHSLLQIIHPCLRLCLPDRIQSKLFVPLLDVLEGGSEPGVHYSRVLALTMAQTFTST